MIINLKWQNQNIYLKISKDNNGNNNKQSNNLSRWSYQQMEKTIQMNKSNNNKDKKNNKLFG